MTNRLDCYEALQSMINCGRASLTDEYRNRMLGSNYRMTELQTACCWASWKCGRSCAKARATPPCSPRLLAASRHRAPCRRNPASRETLYTYVFQYRPAGPAPSRDLFVAALEAEGVPCDGRFYEPVYRSDLFYATPANCPQLDVRRATNRMDYTVAHCPVSERAAYPGIRLAAPISADRRRGGRGAMSPGPCEGVGAHRGVGGGRSGARRREGHGPRPARALERMKNY